MCARGDDRHAAGYGRVFATVVVVLALLACALGAWSVVRGPQLRSAQANPDSLVRFAGQRIVLQANQPLAGIDASQLTIAPAAAAEVEVNGPTITVTLTDPLRYSTDYRIRVVDARSSVTGAVATLEYALHTPDAEVFTLQRSKPAQGEFAGEDQVLRGSLAGGGGGETVFAARRIEAASPGVGSGADTGVETTVITPDLAGMHDLRASPEAGVVAFVADRPDAEGALHAIDLTSSRAMPDPVLGPDGTPLRPRAWAFVPNSTSIVIEDDDGRYLLVDALGAAAPQPIDASGSLSGFLPATLGFVAGVPPQATLVDLASRTTSAFALPATTDLPEARSIVPIDAGRALVAVGDAGDASGGASALYVVDASGAEERYRPPATGSAIHGVCVSPNREFAAVEVTDSASVADGYPGNPGMLGTTTWFVDLDSGAATRGMNGFDASWCA